MTLGSVRDCLSLSLAKATMTTTEDPAVDDLLDLMAGDLLARYDMKEKR